MGPHLSRRFVIALTIVVVAPTLTAFVPQAGFVTEPEAYDLYAIVVPRAWEQMPKDQLLTLQMETEGIAALSTCQPASPPGDAEWDAVIENFRTVNAQSRILRPMFPVSIQYHLLSQTEIAADDARLALKYPGGWQSRPGSMEYVAVSAVGFNATKTKAMVYVRTRSHGTAGYWELRGGTWMPAKNSGGCTWAA
jgi:hypothetical protein